MMWPRIPLIRLMEDYKREPGGTIKLQEKNPKWINDDYVKFIYPFHIGKDIKSVTFNFSSLAHYKIGFYVVYE